MTPPLSDESTRAGLARAIWHNAATLIFDELAAHRLGTRVVSPAAYAPPEPPTHADDLGVSRDAAADYFADN